MEGTDKINTGNDQKPQELSKPPVPISFSRTDFAVYSFMYLATGTALAVCVLPVTATGGLALSGVSYACLWVAVRINFKFPSIGDVIAVLNFVAAGYFGNRAIVHLGMDALPIWKPILLAMATALAAKKSAPIVMSIMMPILWPDFYAQRKAYKEQEAAKKQQMAPAT